MKAALLALLAAGLAAGCSTAPKYVRPALPVPATLPASPPAASGVQPADLAWRDFFTDDRLRRVIALSLENNRDLRIAVANVAQARALYRVQRADLLPTVGVNGSATYGGGGGRGVVGAGAGGAAAGQVVQADLYQASVGVSAWELDLFGRVRNLTEAAQETYFASEGNRDAARTALIAEVASAWLTLAADRDRLRISQETARAFGETLEITRGRAREGVASDLEVRQAQTSYDQARADIAAATTAVAQSRNALNLLAGTTVPAEALPGALGAAEVTLASLPAGLSSEVLLRRPDVIAAEHQLRSANANIGAARAAFFPKISLTAALGVLSPELSGLFDGGSDYWSAGPAVSLPIFDFGRNRGNLRYAEATRDAMVASYERTVQTAFREAADALARRATIDDQLEAQSSLAESAGAAYQIALARYTEGVDPFLTTLDSQRAYYSAQQSLVATRLTRQVNAVELYRALGGGLR